MVVEDKQPSRPNAYQSFQKEVFPKIRALHPSLGMGDISRKISESWKALSEEEKASYALAAVIGIGSTAPPVPSMETEEEQEEEKYEKVMMTQQQVASASAIPSSSLAPQVPLEVAVMNNATCSGVVAATSTATLAGDKKHDSSVLLDPVIISDYFLNGKKASSLTVERIRNEDVYLDEAEKKDIREILEFLDTKNDASLKRLIRENYDLKIPERTSKEKLLEHAYNAERRQKIEQKFSDKIRLVPRSMLTLVKEDKQRLDERRAHLDKMEFWALYLQYRNCYPEDDRGENDITKGQLLQGIMDYEQKEIEIKKSRIAMGIV
jgi:glycerophosphoryl diester phosphodiesterase